MSVSYVITTDFAAKDTLPQGNAGKVIRGSEFTTEFENIQASFQLCAPAASPTFTGTATFGAVDINGGAIDGVVIGGAAAAAGTFTALTASSLTASGTVAAATVDVGTTLDLTGASVIGGADYTGGTFSFTNGNIDTLTIDVSLTAPTVDINGGTLDGVTIGGTVAATGTFSSADINGGTIDGTVIGGVTPAAGSFTTVTATGGSSTNWNTAFGWGDHSVEGYLKASNIPGGSTANIVIDSDFASQGLIKRGASSGSYSIVTDNSGNWNTAYGWGDHSAENYLKNNAVFPGTLWKVNATGTNLYFNYNGANVMRLDSSGNLHLLGNVTAYTTV